VEAINALARFGDKESTPAIVNALDDRDPKVQVAALQALETLEVRDAIPQISRLLKFRNPLVRLRAAEALWRLGVKDGIAELIARMKDNTMDPWAAVVIANLGTKETVPELMKLLKVEASHAQVPAIIVLELLREEAAAPGLIELIDKKNKENEERDVEAIRALGALGARDAVPHLVALLREGTESIKVASIESLGRLGAKEVMPAIERLLEDPSREVRAAAGSCLSEMGSFAGVAALLADERNLFSLNALRRRESWKRLEGLRFKVDPQFPPRRLAVLERLQSEKGLSVEGNLSRFLEDDKVDSVSQWIRVRIGEVTPLDTLRAIGRNSIQFEGELNFEVILEPDRIQMIPTDEAVKFWKEWWKDYQKKK
jgi:HEAT repeat protein